MRSGGDLVRLKAFEFAPKADWAYPRASEDVGLRLGVRVRTCTARQSPPDLVLSFLSGPAVVVAAAVFSVSACASHLELCRLLGVVAPHVIVQPSHDPDATKNKNIAQAISMLISRLMSRILPY